MYLLFGTPGIPSGDGGLLARRPHKVKIFYSGSKENLIQTQMLLLLLELLLELLLLLLLYVFYYVLIQGREAPLYNYVINTYRRSSSSSSSSSICVKEKGNLD